jgi:hypothetical protein
VHRQRQPDLASTGLDRRFVQFVYRIHIVTYVE